MGARFTFFRIFRLARWRLAAVLVIAALAAVGCTGANAVDQTAGGDIRFVQGSDTGQLIAADKRKPAPAISGTTLTGAKVDLAQFKGKVVMLNFWGSWCPDCRVEAPGIESYYTANSAKGLAVLGVNVKDTKGLASAFVANKDLTYPSIFDPDSRVALAFRNLPPASIPATILIDREGRAAAGFLGPMDSAAMTKFVGSLLAET